MENLNRSGDGTYCTLLIAHCSLGIWGPPTPVLPRFTCSVVQLDHCGSGQALNHAPLATWPKSVVLRPPTAQMRCDEVKSRLTSRGGFLSVRLPIAGA